MSRENTHSLPSLKERKQQHKNYARPANVVGRMKPVKFRKQLRKWMKEADPEEEKKVYKELEKSLS